MTVINTNYTTIEEAWGGSSQKNRNGKAAAATRARPTDPLCELYNKRSEKMKRPYAEVAPNSDSLTLATYNKVPYSGRTMQQQQPSGNLRGAALPPASYRPITVNTSEDIYDANRMHDIEDDAYFERALGDDVPGRHGSRLVAYDSPAAEEAPARQPSTPVAPAVVAKEATKSIVSKIKEQTSAHDKLLDFGLYVISGMLMIFTMEQILQLGMRMRPSQ